MSEEEKKAVQERIRAAMQNKRLVPPGPGITFGFRFVWPNLRANHGVRKSIILTDGKPQKNFVIPAKDWKHEVHQD
ncbi:hypothetical protein [Sutterella wadsworthensis]|uniref:hypothetical protein n=1 Tax=Sutterella wadsworthensis TaxID=40545 RepID=UPI003966FEF7